MKKILLTILPLLAVSTLSSCGVSINTVGAATVEADIGSIHVKEEYGYEASLDFKLDENKPEEEIEIDGRYVDENWREYSVWICYKEKADDNKYYTAEPGDYITHIRFDSALISKRPRIEFNVNFYLWDDLEVEFIFDNGYSTGVRKYKSCICSKEIKISKEDGKKFDLTNHYISQLRVRTLD